MHVPFALSTGVFGGLLHSDVLVLVQQRKTRYLFVKLIPSVARHSIGGGFDHFALGTAAGDWVSEELRLGYAVSAIWFGGAIAAVAVAHYFFRLFLQ